MMRSRLNGPAPAVIRYRKIKQYNTASSPPFVIGQNPCGKCALKNATAISPHSKKATGRVNRPSRISRPPKHSKVPASHIWEKKCARAPCPMPPKNPNSFWKPCSEKVKPATMRASDSAYDCNVPTLY